MRADHLGERTREREQNRDRARDVRIVVFKGRRLSRWRAEMAFEGCADGGRRVR